MNIKESYVDHQVWIGLDWIRDEMHGAKDLIVITRRKSSINTKMRRDKNIAQRIDENGAKIIMGCRFGRSIV